MFNPQTNLQTLNVKCYTLIFLLTLKSKTLNAKCYKNEEVRTARHYIILIIYIVLKYFRG